MSEIKTYPVPADIAAKAHINAEQYAAMYQRSIDDPNGFWAEQANQFVTWSKPFDKVMNYSYQLPRPAPGQSWRSGRHHLGGRRSQRRQEDHLSGTARRRLQAGQCPEGQGRQEG